MSILHLTDDNFKSEVLESKLPVLVDFWAPWCGPCRMVALAVEEMAQEYANKIKVGKFNVDESHKIPTQYGVMSIPTLIFFKNGKVMDQVVGVFSKSELKKKIEATLSEATT